MNKNNLLLVNADVLPQVFSGVIKAKELLANGTAKTTSQAVKAAGISRSAFYKYKDFVFKYNSNTVNTVNISASLADKAGVFSALTAVLSKYNSNIVTINQNMPINGVASVSLTITTENLEISLQELIARLNEVDGIINLHETV